MPETIIESVLNGKIDAALLLKWLNSDATEDNPEDSVFLCCNRSEFVAYFLSYLRNQTESILRTHTNAIHLLNHQGTPEKILNSRRKHRRSISDPTSDDRTMDSLSVKTDHQRSQESPSKEKKRTGRRVKTKLFTEEKKEQSVSSDESRLSIGVERVVISSTPLKNGRDYPNVPLTSPVTPNRSFKEYERCDTPRLSQRHSRSHEKSCLGDYLVSAQKSSKKKKGKNTSNDDLDVKVESSAFDLSNSEMFPEIGVRKSSSLRSDRKRIKPTNIDQSSQKSFSLNSFTSECFQQPSPLALEDNIAFKAHNFQTKETTNSFEAERSILKQERHKLMEKFNILNTSDSPKTQTPKIKVIQNNSIEKIHYIKSDNGKVLLKDKIDILVNIYDVLFKKNFILSIITEIYYLISIMLSKQNEIECETAYTNLKNDNLDFLLRSIHNSTYFAVKSLWSQRLTLEVILDKNCLKILGENKKVRSFYPDLAKFLLNLYGLKCEAESTQEKKTVPEIRLSNGVISFNLETDNVDNFPSMLSFQSFRKQRDMFHEIFRWYGESQSQPPGACGAGLRARLRPLLAAPAHHPHLAHLYTRHLLAALPHLSQESKLSKLQRRLTSPSTSESHRLPHFTSKEMFYKDFAMHADNESFRVHLRDALATELLALDAAPLADDRAANNTDLPKEYLHLIKKLTLLGKLLGFLASLPYRLLEVKVGRVVPQEPPPAAPAQQLLANQLASRDYSQPNMDLKGILATAQKSSRLTITLPWLIHYLSMLDYSTFRTKYYQNLTKTIFEIYSSLKHENRYKKNTLIYLKSILGWLFDLPQFPVEFYYESVTLSVVEIEDNIDRYDIIDEMALFELCPNLRDISVLLATCRVGQDHKETFRHITPVSLSLNPEDRIRNKEKELQVRLEEEYIKSQPASTRRVLDLVIERVTSLCVKELVGTHLAAARCQAREQATTLVAQAGGKNLPQALRALYSSHFTQLSGRARQWAADAVRTRSAAALQALLPAAAPALLQCAARACLSRVASWLHRNWTSSAILCKDIDAEIRSLTSPCEVATVAPPRVDVEALTVPTAQFEAQNVSPAACLINLKEHVCLLLEYSPAPPLRLPPAARGGGGAAGGGALCRPPAARALARLTVDLCLVYVSRKPLEVTDSFLSLLHNVWVTFCPDSKRNKPESLPERRQDLSPDLRNFHEDDRVKTPESDEEKVNSPIEGVGGQIVGNMGRNEGNTGRNEGNTGQYEGNNGNKSLDISVNVLDDNNSEFLEYFDRILCPRNIVLLSESKCRASDVWQAMARVLVFLLKNEYLSEDSLTEQCLAVYRQDWQQHILESLSTCMKAVSSQWSRSSAGKFTLFLDFLAEYCGDMDYDPVD